jgi:hypothetical protein
MAFTDAEYGKFQLKNDRPVDTIAEYGKFQLKNDRPVDTIAEYGKFQLNKITLGKWGPLENRLPYYVVKNSYVDSYSITGSENYLTMEMVGNNAPRMFLAVDWSRYQNICFMAKVESLTLPAVTTEFSGFGMLAVNKTTNLLKYLGYCQRPGSTFYSHWIGLQSFEYIDGGGWSSTNMSTSIQTTPFWIACKYSGGVMYHYERVNEYQQWTQKHSYTYSFTSTTDHIGFGFFTLILSPTSTYSITLSNITIGQLLGF